MKCTIFGIPQENYNFKKLENVAKGYIASGYDVEMATSGDLENWNKFANIAFIENDIPDSLDLSLFEKVVVWQNWSPSKIIKFALKYPNVKFCLGIKTPVHDATFRETYFNKFGTNDYLRCDSTNELVDLNECVGIKNNIQKLYSNVSYAYLPCTTTSDSRFVVKKDIDIVYFGTISNRPGVLETIKQLESHPRKPVIRAHFVEKGGPIHPEICVQYYRRAKVCLHEQVGPVWGEFAVRFGEASSQGCRVISYMPIYGISEYFIDELVPEHDYATNIQQAVEKSIFWCDDNNFVESKRSIMRKNSASEKDFIDRINKAFKLLD
jgi:hypothetical protein